jgi:FixJ family two-component response regulator
MKNEQRGVVYVVDDDPSFRTAMGRMLTAAGLSVRSYASSTELLAHLSGEETTEGSGCVLADLRMPGLDGQELQQACAAAGVGLPFVFLTGQGDVPSAVSAMRQGAVDFLDKCVPQSTLLASVARALERAGKARVERAERKRLGRLFATLTAREKEVLRHVVHGKVNKQIASALGVHERTIKLHRTGITTKLGVRTVAELTTLTHEAGVFAELQ